VRPSSACLALGRRVFGTSGERLLQGEGTFLITQDYTKNISLHRKEQT
jgi:hypothetical protein